jgi:hypothetical protein
MAKVPTDFTPNVQNRPLTQNRISDRDANALAFGGGAAQGGQALGQGIEAGAHDLYRAAQELQHRDDTRAARDAMTSLSQKRRDLLYGTETQPGYFHLKGQEAINAAPGVQKQLQDFQKQLSESLGQGARDMFDPVSTNEVQNELDNVTNHSWRERDAADLSSWQSSAQSAYDLAIANPHDEKNLTEQRNVVKTMTMNAGLLAGKSNDEIKADMKKADSNVLKGVIGSLGIRSSAKDADAFYQSHKQDLDGADILDVEDEITKRYRNERTDRANARADANAAREDAERKAGQQLVHAYLTDGLDTKMIDKSGASASMKLEMNTKLESDAAAGGKVVHDDPTTFTKLWNGVVAKDNDPNKIWDSNPIMQAFVERKITGATTDRLLKYVGERDSTPEHKADAMYRDNVMKTAFAELVHEDPITGVTDPMGRQQYNDWLIGFNKSWDEKRKTVSAADLANSKSKDYLGANIGEFKRDPGSIYGSAVPGPAKTDEKITDPAKVPAGTYKTAIEVREALHAGKLDAPTARAIIMRDKLSIGSTDGSGT